LRFAIPGLTNFGRHGSTRLGTVWIDIKNIDWFGRAALTIQLNNIRWKFWAINILSSLLN
jgi:hypothetical protein